MKKIILALALCLAPSLAFAQCTGVFPAATVCGVTAAGPNVPGPLPLSSFALAPGGSSGQVQFNNGSGGLGGYTNTQLTALINAFTSGLSGSVPASGGGTVNFLRADGTFAAPPTPNGTPDLIVNGSAQIDQVYEGTQNTNCDGSNSAFPGASQVTEIYVLDNWRLGCDSGTGRLTGKQTQLPGVAPNGLLYFADIKTLVADTSTTSTNNYHMEIPISGDRIQALLFGTANAQSVTCQFNFAASATISPGTFGIGLVEGVTDAQGVVETFSYTGAGATQHKVVTFPGATTGTWSSSRLQAGLKVIFDLGSGSQFQAPSTGVWTAGPKFAIAGLTKVIASSVEVFINGLQCDPGTVELPYRFNSSAQDLANCQTYLYKTFPIGTPVASSASIAGALSYVVQIGGTTAGGSADRSFPTQSEPTPTIFTFTPIGAGTTWWNFSAAAASGVPAVTLGAGSSGVTIFNPQVAGDGVASKLAIHFVAISRVGTF